MLKSVVAATLLSSTTSISLRSRNDYPTSLDRGRGSSATGSGSASTGAAEPIDNSDYKGDAHWKWVHGSHGGSAGLTKHKLIAGINAGKRYHSIQSEIMAENSSQNQEKQFGGQRYMPYGATHATSTGGTDAGTGPFNNLYTDYITGHTGSTGGATGATGGFTTGFTGTTGSTGSTGATGLSSADAEAEAEEEVAIQATKNPTPSDQGLVCLIASKRTSANDGPIAQHCYDFNKHAKSCRSKYVKSEEEKEKIALCTYDQKLETCTRGEWVSCSDKDLVNDETGSATGNDETGSATGNDETGSAPQNSPTGGTKVGDSTGAESATTVGSGSELHGKEREAALTASATSKVNEDEGKKGTADAPKGVIVNDPVEVPAVVSDGSAEWADKEDKEESTQELTQEPTPLPPGTGGKGTMPPPSKCTKAVQLLNKEMYNTQDQLDYALYGGGPGNVKQLQQKLKEARTAHDNFKCEENGDNGDKKDTDGTKKDIKRTPDVASKNENLLNDIEDSMDKLLEGQ